MLKSKINILTSLEESINLSKLNNATYVTVCNAFFANYITALVLLKIQDISGLLIINDHNHSKLTKFSSTMSDLNFWARALFYSDDMDVKSRMNLDDAKRLYSISSKINSARIQNIMHIPLKDPGSEFKWDEVIASTLLLQHSFHVQSSYLGSILRTLYKWDSISEAGKQKSINDCLMFMLQSDQSSKLIPHLRRLSNLVMTHNIKSSSQTIVNFKRLNETDGGGAISVGAVATSSNAIISTNSQTGHHDTSQDMQSALSGLYKLNKMSPNQISKKSAFTIRNGKLIKKRVKKFEPKLFKVSDFFHTKIKDEAMESNND